MNTAMLLSFLGASALLTFAPGPDNTFIIAQGVSRGRRAAIATALGMCCGVSVHTTAAALGVSAILYSSAWAFSLLKYAGAAYLLYLAYRAVTESTPGSMQNEQKTALIGPSLGALFRRGFLMNVVNPKVALFFLVFLPQFVSPDGYAVPIQMMVLGLVFMLQAVVIFSAIGILSGTIGNAVLKRPAVSRYFAWMTASIFAMLGLRLALARR